MWKTVGIATSLAAAAALLAHSVLAQTPAIKGPDDTKAVARIRSLGFTGLLTLGAHHGPHHLALAKGERPAGHAH